MPESFANLTPKAGAEKIGPGFRREITDADWETCRILVPLEEISYVAAILEGYENEFLIRTEKQGLGFLRLWYPVGTRPTLDAILREMAGDFALQILEFSPGMTGLDEVFSE